jgi:hypothetical protein
MIGSSIVAAQDDIWSSDRGSQGVAPSGGGDGSDDSDEVDAGNPGRSADDGGYVRSRTSSRFAAPDVRNENPSLGISLFTKIYSSDKSKYTGDSDSSFAIYRTMLLKNVNAAKMDTQAARDIHLSLRGDLLMFTVVIVDAMVRSSLPHGGLFP